MKKLLILSGKGGTGKTTTSAAFIQFAQARAFADCDVDAPNLHLVQAVEGEPEAFDYLGSEKASIDPELCTGCGDLRRCLPLRRHPEGGGPLPGGSLRLRGVRGVRLCVPAKGGGAAGGCGGPGAPLSGGAGLFHRPICGRAGATPASWCPR